jgi:hypothetical protein
MTATHLLLPDHPAKLPNTRDFTSEDGESWADAGAKINDSMVVSGQTELDFGAFPGVSNVSVTISGQDDIAAGANVEAFIVYEATDDHSADEHLADPPRVTAGTVVAGTGFTIHGIATGNQLVYGAWTVGWRWSNN